MPTKNGTQVINNVVCDLVLEFPESVKFSHHCSIIVGGWGVILKVNLISAHFHNHNIVFFLGGGAEII